jgi:Zn-dependent alcohol dehydrogenase
VRGIVIDENGSALVHDLARRDPTSDEVVVRIGAAGLCESDVKLHTGVTRHPRPVVMGHEGAGVVVQIGRAVTRAAIGDHVVVHTLRSCGRCRHCRAGRPTTCSAVPAAIASPFRHGDVAVHQFAHTSAFVEETIVHEQQVVVIDRAVPLRCAALMSCALLHGSGAVLHRARVADGDTVAVIGSGPLAVAVVQASRIAGASRIRVVDPGDRTGDDRAAALLTFGATDVAGRDSGRDDAPDGFDHVFVCEGNAATVIDAIEMLGVGGQCVIVAFPGAGPRADFEVRQLYHDKAILGSRAGTSNPDVDIPQLVQWYRDGLLLVDELTGRSIGFDDVVGALELAAAGPSSAARVIVEP